MHFLPDIYVPCDVCQGQRYNRETLEVRYKGKNIHEVLEMTVEDALAFFNAMPAVARKLQTLLDVACPTSSWARTRPRCPAARRSASSWRGNYPSAIPARPCTSWTNRPPACTSTTSSSCWRCCTELRDHGNTIVVIEHNLDVIKTADWIIDLGPEGGDRGGEVVASGTPQAIAGCAASYTGQFLKQVLEPSTRQNVAETRIG